MLEKLTIQNFQSLESLDITLGKLTIIKGSSDVGKSAAVRAIRCLLLNRFTQSFITEGKGRCSISLDFDGGHKVIFDRDGTTLYRLDNVEFSKTARSVPEEVENALRMGRLQFDKGVQATPSLQMQFDPPFLLTEAGHTIAKVLGRISNLNYIFIANSIATKELHSITIRLSSTSDTLSREEEVLSSLSHIPRLRKHLDAAKSLYSNITKLDTNRSTLTAILTRREKVDAEAKTLNTAVLDRDTSGMHSLLDSVAKKKTTTESLKKLASRLARLDTEKSLLNTRPLKANTAPLSDSVETARKLLPVLNRCAITLKRLDLSQVSDEAKLTKLEDSLNEAVAIHKKTLGTSNCPLTGLAFPKPCQESLQKEVSHV